MQWTVIPLDPPAVDPHAPPTERRIPNLGVFLAGANSCLPVPFCIWKGHLGLGSAIDYLVGCYFWSLAFPTTWAARAGMDSRVIWVVSLIVNFVVVSYLLGQLVFPSGGKGIRTKL